MRPISTVTPDQLEPLAAQVEAPDLAQSTPIDHAETDRLIREAINHERAKRWLPVLEPHEALTRAAERHASDMAAHDRLDHFGSDGSNWADRCRDAGYPGASLMTIGENVAGWQRDAAQAVSDWMQSPGHRRAILDPAWQHCGAASGTAESGRSYWCVDFGRPSKD